MATKYVIKHGSGFYYKENKLAKRLVDCFSVFQYPKAATQYNSRDEAQKFVDDFLFEFIVLTIEPIDENNIS